MSGTGPLVVALPGDFEPILREVVEAGEYRSIDEAVSEAITLWSGDRIAYRDELARFRQEVDAALDEPGDDLTIDELRAHFAVKRRSDEAAT